jgi:predicted transcriptional regulator
MKRKEDEKKIAVQMRSRGVSINVIASCLGVAKSSVSNWVRNVEINSDNIHLLHDSSPYKIDFLKEKYYEDPNFCKNCNNILEYDKRKNKFCSSKCSALKNRSKIKKISNCKFCNSEKNTKNDFCSTQCFNNHYWDSRIKDALKTGCTNSEHQASSKNLILKMRGNKCEICDRTKWGDYDIPLVLDHINGKCKDWRLDNLRLVCGNCDMLLPTYKSKNKNSQRKR